MGDCLLFSSITQICSTDFHKIWQKGGTWATKETVRFWRQSRLCYVRGMARVGLGLQLGEGTAILHIGGCFT